MPKRHTNASLATSHPEIASQWHPRLNGKLTPADISTWSHAKVWWKCSRDKQHVWQAAVCNVIKSITGGCPFCSGRRACPSNSLAKLFPDIAKLWHKSKNGRLTPLDVTPGSSKRVWWKCPENKYHSYQKTVIKKRYGEGCPYCANVKVLADVNSLSATHPHLVRQWHKILNKPLSPKEVVSGSPRKVWWQCEAAKDHAWQASISKRARENRGCPFCSGNKVTRSNCLATERPDLAKEWHASKNKRLLKLTVFDLTSGSNKKVWWKCAAAPQHSWLASVSSRSKGNGCPYCVNLKVSNDNRLSVKYPELCKEWHSSKNLNLKPHDVVYGSTKKVWWQCKQSAEHEWDMPVFKRTKQNQGCPYCAGKRVARGDSLAVKYPLVAQQWNYKRNEKLSPFNILPFSNKEVWWNCFEGHVWKAAVYSVVTAREDRSTNGCMKCFLLEQTKLQARSLKPRQKSERRAFAIEKNDELEDELARHLLNKPVIEMQNEEGKRSGKASKLQKPKAVKPKVYRAVKDSQIRAAGLAKPSESKFKWIRNLPARVRVTPIADCQISNRLKYILIRSGTVFLEDLAKQSELSISDKRNFGVKALVELRAWLEKLRMSFVNV